MHSILPTPELHTPYCTVRSDGSSFGGDVVMDSFNKISRDEDNISGQIF